MNARDFNELQLPGSRLRAALAALTAATGLTYLGWRTTVLNYDAPVFSLLFLAAEIFGFLSLALTVFTTWRMPGRTPQVLSRDATVDVFIPTFNEPLDIVRMTAVAALAMRCPHQTWLLDDGNRPEIRALASELGCRYLSRTHNAHAKAGNLNNALAHSSAEFIALLDADHVPEEWFLETLLGYFSDPLVAFVQAPQDFYTYQSIQFSNDSKHGVLWHDQSFFYRAGEAGRDFWNAASFCGTTAILRRSALDAVGGFATATVTEDMHTSVRMHRRGYRSVFHPEPLAFGIAAIDYEEFLQQRLRWGHGNVQTLREENVPFGAGLSVAQRLCYLALGLTYLEGWTRIVFYFTPAVVLLAGVAPIEDTYWYLWFFLPYFLLGCLLVQEIGRGAARLVITEHYAMARFPAYMLAALGLFTRRRHWRITAKRKDKPVSVLWLAPQVAVLAANLAGLAFVAIGNSPALDRSMPMGTVAIVCTWAAFHALIAASVIRAVLRDRLHPRAREFFLSLPMLAGTRRDAQVHCRTVSLQSDRASFDAPAGLRGASLLHVTLYLSGRRFDLEAAVIDESADARGVVRVNVRLLWPESGDARDIYLRLLHSCTWHRALAWPGTHVPTVLERLLDVAGFALRPKPPARWRAVLYSEGPTTKARLGLLRHARHHGEDVIELLVFDEVHGEHVTVLDPAPGESAPARHFLRFAGAWQAHLWPGSSITAWREAGVLQAVVIPRGAEETVEAEPNAVPLRRKH